MRFTERDGQILEAIQTYDGVLSRRQIKQLFWRESSWRVLHRRLAYLHYNNYIAKPDLDDRKIRPIPEPVAWLDWRGALCLAGQVGISVKWPKNINENQLRILQSQLQKAGFRWRREPRWSQLAHDLAVVDVRLAFQQAAISTSHIKIEEWINESSFRADMDVIEFTLNKPKGRPRKWKKGICPDGALVLSDRHRKEMGEPHRARFLLELDMASHDSASFGLEKAAAGAAYIKSSEFQNRFGSNSGRWLVVTTGDIRLQNLMRQTIKYAPNASSLFYFATFEKVISNNLLLDDIWYQPGVDSTVPLPFGVGQGVSDE